MNNFSIEEFFNEIKKANTFAIVTHKNPDGDAVSSCLAFYNYLLSTGKQECNIDVIMPECNNDFSFLPKFNAIKHTNTYEKYDLLLVLDVSVANRVKPNNALSFSNNIIIIDHHDTLNALFSDKTFINTASPSCTNILYNLFKNYTNPDFLYYVATGILSDTSDLELNTTTETKELIDTLKNKKVNIENIRSALFTPNKRTQELLDLLNVRVQTKTLGTHKILYSYLMQDDFLENEKALININHKMLIFYLKKQYPNIDIFMLVMETEHYELKYSMRSFIPSVNLASVAEHLLNKGYLVKGGGHSYSAGCTFKKTDTINNLNTVTQKFNIIYNEILLNK